MVQYANYAGLLTSLPTVEEVLDDHASELGDRKSTRLNSSHAITSRMPSSA